MESVAKAKSKLPLDFITELNNTFTPRIVDKILSGMLEKRYTTLRVNSIKYNVDELKKYFDNIGIKYETVPWFYLYAKFIKYASTSSARAKRK